MKITAVGKTDVGRKRKNNEDAFLIDGEARFFAVADGMGGHAAGEVASKEALAAAFDTMLAGRQEIEKFCAVQDENSAQYVLKMMERAVKGAAYLVYSMTELEPERKGMGTTLSCLLLTPLAAFIAHVGDSRIYMIRGKQVRQLTRDHTLVAEMVARGKLNGEDARAHGLSNVLLRAVGSSEFVEVDTLAVSFKAGDLFLLCSDGLAGYLKGERELLKLITPSDLTLSATRLIQFALEKGGRDNITVVLVRIDP